MGFKHDHFAEHVRAKIEAEETRETEIRGHWITKLLTVLMLFALVCACVAVAIGSVAAAVAGFRYVFGL